MNNIEKLQQFAIAFIASDLILMASMFALDTPMNATPYKFSAILSCIPSMFGQKSIRHIMIVCGSLVWSKYFVNYTLAMIAECADPQVSALRLLFAMGMAYWFHQEKNLI